MPSQRGRVAGGSATKTSSTHAAHRTRHAGAHDAGVGSTGMALEQEVGFGARGAPALLGCPGRQQWREENLLHAEQGADHRVQVSERSDARDFADEETVVAKTSLTSVTARRVARPLRGEEADGAPRHTRNGRPASGEGTAGDRAGRRPRRSATAAACRARREDSPLCSSARTAVGWNRRNVARNLCGPVTSGLGGGSRARSRQNAHSEVATPEARTRRRAGAEGRTALPHALQRSHATGVSPSDLS